MRARLEPVDLTAVELGDRARLVPGRHVAELSNGRWFTVTSVLELAGVVVGYEGDELAVPFGPDELEQGVTFELCHIVQFISAWLFVRRFERAYEHAARARRIEAFARAWLRPVSVGAVQEWKRQRDYRAREPEWKARRRAARRKGVEGR